MLDDLDREIITYLQYDGRTPFTKIANELGSTEGTIRRRVKQMIDQGIMQIVAIVEPQELGLNEAGMIAISVQPDRINAVANEIAQFPEVTYLFQAAGEFDLFAEVYCRDREDYVSFLNDKLQKVKGVIRTQSIIILKMYKLSYRWGEAGPVEPPHRRIMKD
jgi:Lrp/AsnC family transcriptional regulator for asnA, asnC and gidA